LCNVELLRSPAEVELVGDRDKVAKVSKFHGPLL
jgi:hypothetical protein